METVSCPACHTANPTTNNYCNSCGGLLKQSLVGESNVCPFCNKPVSAENIFCPSCGKKIREKQLSTTWTAQAGIYLLSFLLPPLGLWPGFKYVRQKDQKHKTIGIIAIALTFVSILVTGYVAIGLMNEVNKQVSEQMQNLTF